MNNKKIFFLSHGGGPLPVLGDKSHTEMVTNHIKDVHTGYAKLNSQNEN